MNCNVEITAVGTADGLEVSIHGGSGGMVTAAGLIVGRVLMAGGGDGGKIGGLEEKIVEVHKKKGKGCWGGKPCPPLWVSRRV